MSLNTLTTVADIARFADVNPKVARARLRRAGWGANPDSGRYGDILVGSDLYYKVAGIITNVWD